MPIESDTADQRWMRLALELAANGQGCVEPNPMVGCVLVKDGTCIGQGFHRRFGGPHAEIEALRSLPSPSDARGATAYVTLEPCCHHGKTPPCSTALIQARVGRVVCAMRDPFPKVDGGGIGQLRESGIDVTLGVLETAAQSLNAPYLKRLQTGTPWTIAKWAMTADGRIATHTGQSKWISGAGSRRHVHQLRSRVDAIIVGMGTVLADDPMLNARLEDRNLPLQPAPRSQSRIAKRVIVCRQRLPPLESKLVRTANTLPTWVFSSPGVNQSELQRLVECGVRNVAIDTDDPHQMIRQMLEQLGRMEMTNVMLEGGAQLLGSFLDPDSTQCLIDECHVYIGGKLFGGQQAPGPIAGPGIAAIVDAAQLRVQSVDQFDDDVRIVYRRRD
ncbi:bifunctional diaminohydroxyphosphoribosylaminopyrimidine deaminase/5-amino-6-(5-phosphoribosylamino)uracil reductase RibD [Stieleria sp. TO1_6]|uniref:bifunctional diaminohydroxyphosphoribosylaminopyrimidine deaminase/5-amino-6-(5-phosphoribosylamino)uracil reductase RibD n=1 Tax=Stieleria tagensis TaxID=2956795 RepID=UPI00209B50CC|nr:bifunctional diaminohydroxyphosphoribosylaminopyrimidine deaminase/5-amino-6-(5-phosphoribosylamino)uracil reductase RibD [Stieleria tagensis]MCO8122269.1 bifunctional diaminohydroxyphosphoribosylaminopyrimidine deaminase/5-amino-6-(5-phosphoribosylamino)uracil reductase RibD [Stieleria tagensis]